MPTLTNHTRNLLIDAAFRGINSRQVTFPATYYLRLCKTVPSASAAGTEITGTGYAPLALTPSAANFAATNGDATTTNPSTGTTGTTSNNSVLSFTASAAAAWDAISHWELWDAASGGNRWWFGVIVDGAGNPSPRTVSTGDPVQFPVSQFRVQVT